MLDEKEKPVILVAVAAVDPTRREADFTLPGARDFYRFLTLELLPWTEARYRVDADRRTLAGHSYGGLFAGVTLLIENPAERYFSSVLSSDGSFWFEATQTIALEEQLSQLTSRLPVKLVLTSATKGNVVAVQGYKEMMLSRGYEDFDLQHLVFVATHDEVYYRSFRLSIDELFPPTQ